MIPLAIFASMFAMVFCRSFQQKNVNGNHYAAVLPTSFAMAALEILAHTLVLGETIVNGFTLTAALYWAAAGLGGATGCMAAMYTHGRLFR